MNKKDPSEIRLKTIAMDEQLWMLKTADLNEQYISFGKEAKPTSKGCIGLKNLIWPGWLTVAYEDQVSSLYVGYGHNSKQNYYPCSSEAVMAEAEDREECVVDS